MLKSLLCMMMVCALLPQGADDTANKLRSGEWLRIHVIAQDDTDEMQQVKAQVRDGVLAAYQANRPADDASMLENARTLLPLLEDAACTAAREAGFLEDVHLSLVNADFPAYDLGGSVLPAGRYPALMIRLGDARGHNWWGLIDPMMALWSASLPPESSPEALPDTWQWDWSVQGFFRSLMCIFGLCAPTEAADDPQT